MKINIDRVRNGQTTFTFQVPVDAMEILGVEPDQKDIEIQVEADMIGHELHLQIKLNSEFRIACSRCLESFIFQGHEKMIKVYHYNTHIRHTMKDGDFIELPVGTTEIDLSEDIRDMVFLTLPMKPLCSESCQGLCTECGINLNKERCQCQKKGDDRLKVLNQFITPKGG